MDTQKIKVVLYVIAIALVVMLYMKWEAIHAPKPTPQQQTQTTAAATAQAQAQAAQIPTFGAAKSTETASTSKAPAATTATGQYITVNTKSLRLKIDLQGGKIVEAQLLHYPKKLHSKVPFTLLSDQPNQQYFAQSGFVSKQLPDKPLTFRAEQTSYNIGDASHLAVKLEWQGANGVKVIKTYTFPANGYDIGVNEQVVNGSAQPVTGRFYGQLVRQPVVKKHHFLLGNYYTYTGAAVSSASDHYQKVKFKDMAEQNLNVTTPGGWVSMVQHYFISAWVPPAKQTNQLYSRVYGNHYGIGVVYPETTVAAGASYQAHAQLYIGPAIAHNLNAVAPYLNKTIDYGWLWFISDIIFVVMSWIYSIIGNWGWSIILVTILIKLIFWPLSAKSYRSMARMRLLAPRIKQMKERLGGDKQAIGKATMELYRKEKVNPLGGCLPMVIQIPVFFALYWVLIESVELRQAPFIFWIHDLSVRDPYFILPILMGLSMFAQQKLNPAPADPAQAKMMMFLPIIFTVMFAFFPAGLVLYWLANNLVSIGQQWWVTRSVARQAEAAKRKR